VSPLLTPPALRRHRQLSDRVLFIPAGEKRHRNLIHITSKPSADTTSPPPAPPAWRSGPRSSCRGEKRRRETNMYQKSYLLATPAWRSVARSSCRGGGKGAAGGVRARVWQNLVVRMRCLITSDRLPAPGGRCATRIPPANAPLFVQLALRPKSERTTCWCSFQVWGVHRVRTGTGCCPGTFRQSRGPG